MQFVMDFIKKAMAFFSKTDSIGIEQTTEALVAMNEVSLFMIAKFREGYGPGNFQKIYGDLMADEGLRNKLMAAYDNYAMIPDEMKDISGRETLALGKIQMDYVNKFGAAFAAPVGK